MRDPRPGRSCSSRSSRSRRSDRSRSGRGSAGRSARGSSGRGESPTSPAGRGISGRGISGRTIDLGAGGMRIATDRPLRVDEVIRFDPPLGGRHAEGRARVLRMQGLNVYALRFEDLREEDRLLLSRTIGQTA